MVIGVVTEPKKNTKRLTLQRIFGYISVKSVLCRENPFDLLIAILPYSEKELIRKKDQKVKKLTEKAKRKLVKKGAQEIVFSVFMNEKYNGHKNEAKELFFKYAPQCIRKTTNEMKTNLFESRVCIRDSKMERISENLINQLCFDIKNLVLITENTQKAQKLCERFYDETGLLVEVREGQPQRFDVLIDVDKGCIRFGSDLAVCGADMGYNFFGYNIDQLDVAVAAKDVERLPRAWIFDHKKLC